MDSRELTRKLIRFTIMGLGSLTLASLVGAFCLHTYGAHRLASARAEFESRWADLPLQHPPPPVPDDENGAVWLVAGGQAIVCSIDDIELFGRLSDLPATQWSSDERARIERILVEQHHAIALLLRTGACDSFFLGRNGVHATHEDINLLGIVRGLRLLVIEARVAWSEHRTLDSLVALQAVSRSADGLLQTPVVGALTAGAAAQRWVSRMAVEVVEDPCSDLETLRALQHVLPTGDPMYRGNQTLVAAVAEIANEGLTYTDDHHDPSLGWSIPFWVSNRYLIEDLVAAEILERWSRYLELGQQPVAGWPADAARSLVGDGRWPPWLAMAGSYIPNLLGVWARIQAASSERQLVDLAIEMRLRSPTGLDPNACGLADGSSVTALTGEPVRCRFDEDRQVIVVDLPGAQEALRNHLSDRGIVGGVTVIELPVARRSDCD